MNRALFVLVLTCVGCATSGKYAERLKRFEGKPISYLVSEWGIPTKQMPLPDGATAVEYVETNEGTAYIPAGGAVHAIDTSSSCRTTFMTDKSQTIRTIRFEGGFCISN